jgi:hypothetical protein
MKSKSQQETVGFVLIVVIVMVIGVIFLGFSVGKGETSKQKSIEIANFLDAAIILTSNCSFSSGYLDMQDLIKACYNNQDCLDGRKSCDAAKQEIEKIIVKSWEIEESPNKAFNLSVYYTVSNSSLKDNLFQVSRGKFQNCTSKPGAASSIVESSMSSGYINVELEICRVE